ncbi:uncharacterized protein SPSK_00660 [Sporothrix schenckii 1099-18]|uniref:Uncharacterized protein n=1 Tax=Sporothrix schenckii 1099-18 TaxID=1397361 RepID=A0A0F2LZB0_SPOSC|nr:uncharacterized protein SPSK_00660 [Sporothrix schenckii 1099-18]KJR81840.1 hypothetical protein SPSK_00660 [Sporothrix schenckii 1099-18]
MAYPPSESGSASRPASGTTSTSQRPRSRAPSISSDRPSTTTVGLGLMSPPLSISPDAAFIAASAASQIVTSDHDNHANTWYDQHGIEPSGETALVSNAALLLVNNFLDQLLFNFLSIARSTSLTALRPAVTEVLKPKLAKDAINQADEELREYLGGGDDEDMLQSQTPDSPKDWDLELVWKRTRLRCMVYSSLGDMEEEDEDFYMEQEHLDGGDESLGETVSPAVAIFLTSILEFMGEQALTSAGQAAYHRMRFIFEKEQKTAGAASGRAPVAERITVEEVDMDRVAFDRTIGRLWRAWKKRIRSPFTDVHTFQQRSIQHELGRPSTHARQPSQDGSVVAGAISEAGEHGDDASVQNDRSESTEETAEKSAQEEEEEEQDDSDKPEGEPGVERDEQEWLSLALSVPLPLNERDVTEILLPGLGYYSDDEELDDADEHDAFGRRQKKAIDDPSRPKSLMVFSHAVMAGLPTPTLSEPRTPEMPYSRKRANSLPTPSTSPFASPSAKRVKPSEADEEVQPEGEGETEEEYTSAPEAADHEAESDDSLVETVDGEETNTAVAPKAVVAKQKKRPSFPPPLQTTIIGAAITTSTARAVPVSSMATENGSGRDDGEEEFDEFTEEPEILTSSRVSISGRSNSPSTSEHGRPVSMSPSLPARSPSVHSPRVIDVAGPRSPVTRSRNGSIDIVNDTVAPSRASNTSRTSSISVRAIAEEGNVRSVEQATSHPRVSLTSAKMARTHTSESISEAEEMVATNGQSTSRPSEPKPVPTKASVPSPQSSARLTASTSPSQQSMRPPPPPTTTAPTKVTILSSTASPGTFYVDDKPEVPAKTQPAELALPERSAKRQGMSNISAMAGAAAAAVAAGAVTGAAASSSHARSPLREQPPSPSRGVNQSSPSTSREQQAQSQTQGQAQAQAQAPTRADAQLRAEAEAAGRKQSVASSISSSTSKFKQPKRSSEESTVMRPEDVARNFEQLIQSDQTIQYTLTPENMRDMDSTRSIHDGSSIVVKSRKSEDARQTSDRSRSSSLNNRGEDKRSASISRASTFDTTRSIDTTATVKLSGPVPRSPRSIAPSGGSMPFKARGPGPQAREARVPRESLADFAEFIRGTGPAGGSVVTPPSRSSTMNGSVSNATRALHSTAGMSKTSIESGRASTVSNRPRYQAREAVVDKDDNSDLIDFIRRGPPSAMGGSNNPRIPRTVAPFRTTMDSDQMSGAVGGRAIDANLPNLRYSAASTSVTESSMGSSAGLLKKDKQPSPRIGASQSANNIFDGPDAMPMPKRKTRRVKDPYAIDLSDEDDEFDAVLPASGSGRRPAPAAKEESLLDFLNSVPPPADAEPVLFDIPQTRSRQPPPVPKKKASAPSLMSRFVRNNSVSGNSSSRGPGSSSGSYSGFGGFDSRSLISRAGSTMTGRSRNHIPIQVNIPPGLDKYGTTSSAAAPQSGMNGGSHPAAASSGSGRVPMKKFEPREAQPTASRATQDLADFFRNSGPPQSFRG